MQYRVNPNSNIVLKSKNLFIYIRVCNHFCKKSNFLLFIRYYSVTKMYFDPIYPKDHLILINILAYFPTRKLTDILIKCGFSF